MKTTSYLCNICNSLHDEYRDALECCADVSEIEVDEDCECEHREECTKGCFDLFPKFPKGNLGTADYVRQYEQLNRLKVAE